MAEVGKNVAPHGGAALPVSRCERGSETPCRAGQAVNDDPQPQPPVALGLPKVKPEPCIEVT